VKPAPARPKTPGAALRLPGGKFMLVGAACDLEPGRARFLD